VLSKSVRKIGNRNVIKLGDKELDYSEEFRFYMTTKLPNPHYMPEVSTKATIVNFSVKQQGLEAQLLGIVVQQEEPKLEQQKSELTLRVADGKRKLVELEDEILRLLSDSTGSLLDDESLVTTLQNSKVTSEEVKEQLEVAEVTEKKIDIAREGYRSAAVRASIIYFVLMDLGLVDSMYQFSLDAYVILFNQSIELSRGGPSSDVSARCKSINTFHTLAVYNYTCRGLFERHKLLFSFQMGVKILQNEGRVPLDEYTFLLFGGTVLNKAEQRTNPCAAWVMEANWDNVTELEKLAAFEGLAGSFEQSPKDWRNWFMSGRCVRNLSLHCILFS
jgi:dynein heavy chain